MNIEELLDMMDETLEEAVNLPFSGGKRVVDVEKVRDIIDDIRLNMPTEIRQAKAIVQDRAEIVDDAKKEAEAIVKRAEDRARAMVAQEAIVKAAQQRATEILSSAQSQSREMRGAHHAAPKRQKGHCALRRAREQERLRGVGPAACRSLWRPVRARGQARPCKYACGLALTGRQDAL